MKNFYRLKQIDGKGWSLIFAILLMLLSASAFSQKEVNLKGIHYPGYIPDENGCALVEHNFLPYATYHYIHIPKIQHFYTTESGKASIVELNLYFAEGHVDTTIYSKDSSIQNVYEKGEIQEFVIFPRFSDGHNIIEKNALFFCPEKQHRYWVKVEFITSKKISYQLFYKENCQKVTEMKLIRYGHILLRKGKPSRYRNKYGGCSY